MTDASHLFHTREKMEAQGWQMHGNIFSRGDEQMFPLYEGKMSHHFDHRWGTFYGIGTDDIRDLTPGGKADPHVFAQPRYWISEQDIPTGKVDRHGRPILEAGVATRLRIMHWDRGWLYGWRDVARSTDERTAIPAFVPRTAIGHKFPLMFSDQEPERIAALCACQSSLIFDYVSRQKIGTTSMGLYIWKQLPVPTPDDLARHVPFMVPRVLELVYTAWDMEPLARDLGDEGAPFHWDEERRAIMRAELDAYFFHLYGIDRDDVDYIMETFQTESGGLKHNDIAKFGSYRTKDLILDVYDRMTPSGLALDKPLVDGETFTSVLVPPPGEGPRHPFHEA